MYPTKDARELAILLRISRELDIIGDVTVWFPPNRGGLGYAASRTGAAVFS